MKRLFIKNWTILCDKFATVKINTHNSMNLNDKTRMRISRMLQRLAYVSIVLFVVLFVIHLIQN